MICNRAVAFFKKTGYTGPGGIDLFRAGGIIFDVSGYFPGVCAGH